ncbi:uncharacterized protein [Euphorbia lathyris]|uniref:uncharacterized protein n=1 Tax=Euphorbia lathyris TaxID=212925 RepID=UPI003313D08C
MMGLRAGSIAGVASLRMLQALSSLTSSSVDENVALECDEEQEEQITMWNLNVALEPIDIYDNETRREKLGKHIISELEQLLAHNFRVRTTVGYVTGETESSAECEEKEIEIVTSRKFKCAKATPKK